MTFRTRNLARAGATALLATGVLAALATPALAAAPAADADLGVKLAGVSVAKTASGKLSTATITNHSDSATATGVVFVYSLGELDTTKVDFVPAEGQEDCKKQDAIGDKKGSFIVCAAGEVKPGENADHAFYLVRKDGAKPGPAGKLRLGVAHDGKDAVEGNNGAVADVTIAESGVDLFVVALDVQNYDDEAPKPLNPGETGILLSVFSNEGDQVATGVKFGVSLPAGATFAEAVEGCTYGADKRTATCSYADLPLIPADQDKDPESDKDGISGGFLAWPVTVAKDAKSGVALRNGVVAIESLGVQPAKAAQRSASANPKPAKLPANFSLAAPAGAKAVADVDPTDNSDEFSVLVAKKAAAPGGTGGGGSLPVTGPQAALFGGVGLAAAIAGGLMFVAARRRRVVLVTPGDEKSPTV